MFEASRLEPTLELLKGGTSVEYFESASEVALDRQLALLRIARARIDTVEANAPVALKRLREQTTGSARHDDSADDLAERHGEARNVARKKARRARLCEYHPAVAGALADGRITAGHADALASIPKKHRDALDADLDRLLAQGASESVDAFSDRVRRWRETQSVRNGDDYHKSRRDRRNLWMRRDRYSGMTRIGGLLDPETAATVGSLLGEIEQSRLRDDQEAAAEDEEFEMPSSGQRGADALAEICRLARSARAVDTGRAEPTLVVTIPFADLLSGLGDALALDGGPISAETARRLACEGGLIPAVLGSAGQVLDLGRRTRLATAGQRLAMESRYQGCAVPSCDAPFHWCHMHHIDHWEAGGRTDLDNLIPVCTRHHAQIHDGRLHLERDATGADLWKRRRSRSGPDQPTGRVNSTVPVT